MTTSTSDVAADRDLADAASIAVRWTCLLLDDERFAEWLDCFADDATYEVVAHSAELQRDMRWLDLSRSELAARVENVDRFVRDRAARMRVPTVMAVQPRDDVVEVMSYVVVYRTDLDGSSSLYAVMRYYDVWATNPEWKLASRRVLLGTRMLPTGSHVPL